MIALQADDLSKTFGRGPAAVSAVNGVNISVNAGELVLLLGPSGSGKTTLVSMLAGLLHPTRGTVRLAGRTLPSSQSELARVRLASIGFVFQTFNLLPGFTALENAALPLRLMGVKGRMARDHAAFILETLGLGRKLADRPGTLSGGEKQRVSLARALVTQPAVLLADEPTASLDSKTGHETMEVMVASVRERGQACLVVTHDTRLIDFADRVLQIQDGRIEAATAS